MSGIRFLLILTLVGAPLNGYSQTCAETIRAVQRLVKKQTSEAARRAELGRSLLGRSARRLEQGLMVSVGWNRSKTVPKILRLIPRPGAAPKRMRPDRTLSYFSEALHGMATDPNALTFAVSEPARIQELVADLERQSRRAPKALAGAAALFGGSSLSAYSLPFLIEGLRTHSEWLQHIGYASAVTGLALSSLGLVSLARFFVHSIEERVPVVDFLRDVSDDACDEPGERWLYAEYVGVLRVHGLALGYVCDENGSYLVTATRSHFPYVPPEQSFNPLH